MTGLVDTTRITPRSPRSTGVKRRSLRKNTRSMPALAKASGDASLATTSSLLRPPVSNNWISAFNGWLSAECKVISPSPSADASVEQASNDAAMTLLQNTPRALRPAPSTAASELFSMRPLIETTAGFSRNQLDFSIRCKIMVENARLRLRIFPDWPESASAPAC